MAELHIRASLCLLAAVAITGCAPARPTMTPPAPSPTCTPEAGGKPYACTPYDHDQMIAKDKLYTEAEGVYRAFLAEDQRIYRLGGVTKPTPTMLQTTTGNYLDDSMKIYKDLYARHSRAVGGRFAIPWMRRVPAESFGGSVAALKICSDPSSVRIGPNPTDAKPGLIIQETGYFTRTPTGLKLSDAQTEVVPRC